MVAGESRLNIRGDLVFNQNMTFLRPVFLSLFLLAAAGAPAAEKPAAKPGDKAAKADPKAGDKGKETKAAPLGDLPAPPPRLTFQGIKGSPGVATYENLQGKVPADKSELVAKALVDAKLPTLVGLYTTLRTAHEAATKAAAEAAMVEKDADRDKAKVEKAQAEADRTKTSYNLRFEHTKAVKLLQNAKDDAEHTNSVKKKRDDEAKTAADAYATAKAAYEKALAEAQPAIDTFRKEGAIPAAK